MKKTLSIILALIMVLSAVPFAYAAESGTSGQCGDNAYWSFEKETGVLKISGSGNMNDFLQSEYIGAKVPWKNYSDQIKSVVIENGITSIGGFAFNNCSLTNLTIPDSVTSIGISAFLRCSNLTNVTIPDSVISIGEYAFKGCISLTSMAIPDSVTSIGECAFDGCSSLTNLTIPDSVTSIGDAAFDGCSSLTSVNIPNGVTSIGNYVFCDCSSLTNLTIPDSVTNIGNGAFDGCSNLTNLIIPDSVTSIGSSAFEDCSSLTNLTIPDGVTSIGFGAFYNCKNLTNLTIPDCVTSIGNAAFCGCSSLTSVNIPNGVTSIGNYVFCDCSSLTNLTIPDSVTNIGEYAFKGCISLTSMAIPDSVTSIGECAFTDCICLTEIKVSENNTDYLDIDGVLFNKDKTELIAYSPANERTSYTIPAGVKRIADGAFEFCLNLKELTVCDDVEEIDTSAFYGCFNLEHLNLGKGIKKIGRSAFGLLLSLKNDIIFNEGLEEIESNAFDLLKQDELTIPSTVTNIGYNIFGIGAVDSVVNKSKVASLPPGDFCYSEQSRNMLIDFYKTVLCKNGFENSEEKYEYYKKVYQDVHEGGFEAESEPYKTAVSYVNNKYGTSFKNYEEFEDYLNTDVTDKPYYNIVCYEDSAQHEVCIENGYTHSIIDGPDYICNPTSGQCGDNAYWSFDTETKTLTITGSGEMYDFHNNQPWADFKDEIVTVIVEPGLTNIGANAFNGYTNLKSVSIPASLEYISDDFLVECYNLKEIKVSESNPNYLDVDGVLFNKDKSELIIYPARKEGASYTIPSGVKRIAEFAFGFNTNLKEVTVCDDVEELGRYAFLICLNLERLNLGEGIKKIGEEAFLGLFNLKNDIILNEGLEEIGDFAFEFLNQSEITIPSTVTSIGEKAFDSAAVDTIVNKSKVASLPLSDFYTSKQSRIMMNDFYKVLYQELFRDGYDGSEEKELKAFEAGVSYINEKFGTSFISTDDLIYYCKTDGSDKPYYNIVCYEDSAQHDVCIENGYTHSIIDSTCDDACGIHNIYTNDIMEPTCTENGYKGGKVCLDCEKIFEPAEVIPATGHTPVKTEGLRPTCTEIGFEDAVVCEVCGELLEDLKLIQATGHTDKNNDGICDNCGEKYEDFEPEPIPETFSQRIINFFKGIVNAILELFKRLFG